MEETRDEKLREADVNKSSWRETELRNKARKEGEKKRTREEREGTGLDVGKRRIYAYGEKKIEHGDEWED